MNYHQVKIDAAGYKDRVWDLGGSYDFGVVKLAGVYGQIKNDGLFGATLNHKAKQWMVGATVPVGAAGNVLVSYSRNKIDSDVAAADGAKASKWALGYTHSLSKRTNLYAVYAKISTNNEAEGSFSVKGGAAIGGGADDYTSGLNLGIRHMF